MSALSKLEQEIRWGLQSGSEVVYRVGTALAQIRDGKLYRECGYRSFEKYTKEQFSMSRARAYHLISAAEVIADLKPHFDDKALPKNESVVRPLMRFSTDKRIDIWKAVLAVYSDPRREDVLSISQTFP
jgi:hypothetical protein